MADSADRKSTQPKAVEMPRPTAWPLVIALGLTLVMLGVATDIAFSIVGGTLFVIGLVGWIANLLPGRGHELEQLGETAATTPIVPRLGAVTQLKPGVVGYRFQMPEKVHPVTAGVRGGIVGGLLMPIPALAWGAFVSGHGIWFPVNLLAGLVIPGLTDVPADQLVQHLEQFHFWWFVGALVMHVLMSISFGLIGGVLLPTLPQIPGGPLLFGGLILPLLWSGANHSMMGIVNPILNHYIDWPWYVVSQLVYGIATSIVILRSEKIPIAPRGRGDEGGSVIPPSIVGVLALGYVLLSGCSGNWEHLPGKPEKKNEFVLPQNVKDFATLYAQRCAGCHGADGKLGPGPPLNDPLYVALVSEDDLRSVIAEGRPGTLMPAWSQSAGGPLTAEQMAILTQGIKQEKWKSVGDASTKAVYAEHPQLRAAPGAGVGNIESGGKIFASACAGCHRKDGDAGAVDDLAFLALMSDQILRRYIITGRPDLGMPNFAESAGRDKDFTPLTGAQVSDLVALMSSWRVRGTAE